MRNPAIPLVLLAPLMLVSAASRLSASGESGHAPEKKKTEERTVVVDGQKKILVDGDRVVVLDGDADVDVDPVIVGDLPDPDGDDLPRVVRFRGHPTGGYLGVRSIEMTPELRQHFGAPRDAGVLVGTVEPESPAAKAGIQVGDILTAIDGDEVGSTRDLSRSVRRHNAGDAVKVDLLRERAKKTLTVTIRQREGRSGDHEDFRVGEFGHGPRGFAWKDWERSWRDWDRGDFATPPPVPPVPAVPNGSRRWNGLEDRMNSLEQRLKELEGRIPAPPR